MIKNTLILAAEEGVDLNPFNPEFGLYVWTLIAFAVVFYVMAKKVFPKLTETLADREQQIKGDLEQAEQTRKEAEQVLEDYKARVAQAREESNRIVDEARQAAESVRADLIHRAEGEARLIVDKAQKELAGERDRTTQALQSQLAQWSTQIASLIVEKQLDPGAQKELVESFIRDVQKEDARS